MPGALTFAITAPRLGGGLVVDDAEALATMRVAFEEFRFMTEPGGAIALAAALMGGLPVAGRTVAAVLTAMYVRALSMPV